MRLDAPRRARVTVFDHRLAKQGEQTVRLEDGARLAVPAGGLAEIVPA